jgi:hypothetical protein
MGQERRSRSFGAERSLSFRTPTRPAPAIRLTTTDATPSGLERHSVRTSLSRNAYGWPEPFETTCNRAHARNSRARRQSCGGATDEVRLARKPAHVQPITEAHGVHHAAHGPFRPGVLAADERHTPVALLWSHAIHSCLRRFGAAGQKISMRSMSGVMTAASPWCALSL